MEKKNSMKEIFGLAIPIALQQFMLALVSACDAVMLGQLSQDAMSAVSLATQITFVFNLFMSAFVTVENMFVAQYYGKKDFKNISRVVSIVFRLSFAVAMVFWIGTLAFPQSLMRFFTNEEALVQMGAQYLKVVGVSYLLSAIAQTFMTVMKNCGAVKMSTANSCVTVLMNICLNAVLIYGLFGMPKMEIRGAALATVISTLVQLIWSVVYCYKKMPDLKLKVFERDKELSKRFGSKTAPVVTNSLAWGCGITMYSVILGHMGTDAIAANSIANISKNLIVCLCLGLGSAGSILVGNRLGADRLEEAKEIGGKLIRISIYCGIGTGLLLYALSPLILRFVNLTPDAEHYLKLMLFVCGYYIAGKSINAMTIGGIFQAGGDSKFGMICDSVTLWCVCVPLGAIGAFVLKLPVMAVYVILNLDEIIKLPIVFKHYYKYVWVRNLTRRMEE